MQRYSCTAYLCRSPDEALPLESSPNFTNKDIGEPILDAILQPGDLLYFPRGTIHQVPALLLVTHCTCPVWTTISPHSLLYRMQPQK